MSRQAALQVKGRKMEMRGIRQVVEIQIRRREVENRPRIREDVPQPLPLQDHG
jgi:hypothetical protein